MKMPKTKYVPTAEDLKYVQEIFEELERQGEVRRTGKYRRGQPVYVSTKLQEEGK
jgi:hypothetical protein